MQKILIYKLKKCPFDNYFFLLFRGACATLRVGRILFDFSCLQMRKFSWNSVKKGWVFMKKKTVLIIVGGLLVIALGVVIGLNLNNKINTL